MQEFFSNSGSVEEMINTLKKRLLFELKVQYPGVNLFDDKNLTFSLQDIYEWERVPFVILIDEWDCVFRERVTDERAQRKYLDFLRDWLKDKAYTVLVYMTGILPIKKYASHSALKMNEVYEFIDFRNQTRATIEKLYRFDVRDYPEIAVREALLNLLVHRDYSFSASALISIYENRIEFVAIGGLLPGIDLEDAMIGISVCRNQELANVFYRLHLIEAYGTGIGKIMKAYEDVEEKPVIETTKNAFKIILPNINAKYEAVGGLVREGTIGAGYCVRGAAGRTGLGRAELGSEEEKILSYVRAHGSVTKTDAGRMLGVSDSTALRVIRKMVKNSLLKQVGKARNTRYIVDEPLDGFGIYGHDNIKS